MVMCDKKQPTCIANRQSQRSSLKMKVTLCLPNAFLANEGLMKGSHLAWEGRLVTMGEAVGNHGRGSWCPWKGQLVTMGEGEHCSILGSTVICSIGEGWTIEAKHILARLWHTQNLSLEDLAGLPFHCFCNIGSLCSSCLRVPPMGLE